jgi:hypothetical protein
MGISPSQRVDIGIGPYLLVINKTQGTLKICDWLKIFSWWDALNVHFSLLQVLYPRIYKKPFL